MKNIVRLLVLSLLFALPAAAQSWDWSMPGSAGIIDPAAITVWDLTATTFRIRTNSVGSVTARYPVTNTYGSSSDISPAWGTLEATISDSSATAASVTATLYQVDKCSDQETALCTITSNDGDGTPTCQTCTFSGGLDFANNAYYVLVTATKTDVPPVAELHSLAIY